MSDLVVDELYGVSLWRISAKGRAVGQQEQNILQQRRFWNVAFSVAELS